MSVIREKITAKKYDAIISLGADCLPALTFQTLGLADRYFPLDFICFRQQNEQQLYEIIHLIKNNFNDFFEYNDLCKKASLDNNQKAEIYNQHTGYQFPHEIMASEELKDKYSSIKDKYDRRIKRFYETAENAKSVLFIYMEKNHVKHPDKDIYLQVWQALKAKFPQTDVNCLFFEHNERLGKLEYKENYLTDNVLLVQINNDEKYTLRTGDGWWRNETMFRDLFFKYCLLNKPHKINKKPKVSFLLPTYNSEKYLIQCVNSILNQTYQDFEVVVVDDASKDNTRQILESYNDERIRIVDGPHNGLAAALNLGIKKAKGEYIARIDADDLALPTRIEKQTAYLDKHTDISIVGSWQEHFGNRIFIHQAAADWEELKASLIFRCDLCHSTLMLRKSDLIKYNLFYPENSLQEDYELWCKAIKYIKFANIPEILGMYRVSGESITDDKQEQLVKYEANLTAKNLTDYFGITLQPRDIELVTLRKKFYKKLSEEQQVNFEKRLNDLYKLIEQQNEKVHFVDPQFLRKELIYEWSCICCGNCSISTPYYNKNTKSNNFEKLQVKLFSFIPIYSKTNKKGKTKHKILGIPLWSVQKFGNITKTRYSCMGMPILDIYDEEKELDIKNSISAKETFFSYTKIQNWLNLKSYYFIKNKYIRRNKLNKDDYNIVSLGWNCLSRTIPTQWGIKKQKDEGELSYPFDLSMHDVKYIPQVIQNDFYDYLDNVEKKDNIWCNTTYNIIFNHDETCQTIDEFQTRYLNRIKNFSNILQSNKPSLFIYNARDDGSDSIKDIENLKKAVYSKCNMQKKKFLVISPVELHSDDQDITILYSPVPYKGYVWWKDDCRYSFKGCMYEKRIVEKISQLLKEII